MHGHLSAARVLGLLGAFLVFMAVPRGRAEAADGGFPRSWHTYQGQREHDGFVPLTVDPAALAERWQRTFEAGAWASAAAGGDGRVLLRVNRLLYELESGSGALLWTGGFDNRGWRNPPAYAEGRAYAQTDYHLWGYDLAAGRALFQSRYDSPSTEYCAPTVDAGTVYMSGRNGGGMYAFDAVHGTERWSVSFGDMRTPAVNDTCAFSYTSRNPPRLVAVDKTTGALVMEIQDADFGLWHGDMSLAPVLGAANDVILILKNRLVSFDLASRSIAWQKAEQFTGQPSLGRGVIYAVNGGAVEARDEAAGALLWSWTPPEGPLVTPLLVTENLLFVGAGAHTYAVDLTTHAAVWSLGKTGSMSFIDGALVIVDDSVITAIELEGDADGDGLPEWWERRYGGDLDPGSDADADGLAARTEYEHRTDPTNADSDGDGLSDGVEVLNDGTDPNDADSDEDGLSDADEVLVYGSNPRTFDTDGDGIGDGMELAHGFDPRNPADGAADGDGDSYDNRWEVLAGADPRDGASVPPISDWSMLQANASHNGYQPLLLDAASFAPRWTVAREQYFPGAATGDGKVFTVDGRNVVALDAWTGVEKWVYALNVSSSVSAPTFANDLVYVHTGGHADTALWAFRKDTGERVFRGVHGSQWRYYSAPTIFGARAYVDGEGDVKTFDALTGAPSWNAPADVADWWEPAVDGEHVFVILNGNIVALQPQTGAGLFTIGANAVSQTPVLGSRGNVLVSGATLTSYDLATREAVWRVAFPGGDFGMPAVGNGIVCSVQGGGLVALSEASGALLWRWQPEADALSSNVVLTVRHVFAGSGTTTYAIDTATQRMAWSQPRGGSLALGREGVLVIAGATEVTAIEVEGDTDGDGLPQWWERRYGGHVDPASDGDGDGLTARAEYERGTDPTTSDTDGDGLSDGAEALQYGSDPNAADGDKDGLSDADEVLEHGTDPRVSDTDGDGIDDGVEIACGLDPRDASDGAADFDGDGFDNRYEALAGTDARDGASFPALADWSMLQGNARHGGYQPLLLDPANFALRWTVTRAKSVSRVSTADGKVFVGGGDTVAALDGKTGAEAWALTMKNAFVDAASLAGDLVYVNGGQSGGRLWAFDKSTGERVFRAMLGTTYGAPTIFDDRTYVRGEYSLEVVDARTGARLWNSSLVDRMGEWTATVAKEYVLTTKGGDLWALDPRTGATLFTIDASVVTQTPVLGDRGNVLLAGTTLASYDLATRKAVWEVAAVGGDFQMPAVGNGVVYTLQDGGLVAFDEASGRLLWQWRLPLEPLSSNVVATVRHVFVGSASATYAIDRGTQRMVWSYPQGGTLSLGIDGALMIVNGTTVTAVEVEGDTDGDGLPEWWERRYGGNLDPAADIDGDGFTALAEYEHGTDPRNADSDGDGLADGAEVAQYGTDPNTPDCDEDSLSDGAEVTVHGSDPLAFDTDGDGVDDALEAASGLDPRDATDAAADFDGDGYDNRYEALARTDPRDGASFPVLSDWSMLQGNPRHDGYQPLLLDTADFMLRWKVTRGGGVSKVAMGSGMVFLTNARNAVALDGRTGAEKWVHAVPASAAVSAPSFANDLVYVHGPGTGESGLWALEKSTGAQVFKAAHTVRLSDYDAPTIFADRAYVNGGGTVEAFDALTGAKAWSASASTGEPWEPAVDDARAFAILNGDVQVLDRLTGAGQLTIDANVTVQTPVVGSRGNVLVCGAALASYDAATGALMWQAAAPGGYLMPAVANGVVFSVHDGALLALDEATGRQLWQWLPPSTDLTSNIVATARHVFVGSSTATYAVDVRTQQLAWSYAQAGTLALGKDGVLVITIGSVATAIDVEGDTDGDGLPEWWERRYGGHLDPAADIDGDGLSALQEYEHGTDPTKSDGDGDGLSDGAEVTQYGTDPNTPDCDKDGLSDGAEVGTYGSDPLAFDTDGDGLDDGTEVAHGLDPRDAADAAADDDGDGFDNRHEVLAGTDPGDPASFPVISDWGMIQGNASHDGYQPFLLDAKNFALRWTVTRQGTVSNAATGGGKVFVVSARSVVALDVGTGAEKWVRAINQNVTVSAPSFANDLVYVRSGLTNGADFWAFRQDTGTQAFQATRSVTSARYGAPTIFGDRAYVHLRSSGGVEACNALTGATRWQSDAMDGTDYVEPAVDAVSVVAVKSGDLRALDPLTGASQFTIDANLPAQTPVFGNRGNVLVCGPALASYDAATQKLAWEVAAVGDNFRMPASGNGLVFSVQAGTLFVFSEASGQRLWQWQPPSGTLGANVVVTVGHVFASTASTTYAIDLTTRAQVWSCAQGGALALGKECMLIIAGGSTVTAIDLEGDTDADGLPQWWERRHGGNLDPAADIDGDGLTALEEYEHGTDPTKSDSDGDGLADGAEVLERGTDPNNPDSDKDGLTDGDEVTRDGSDPRTFDTDGDGLDDGTEAAHGLDPRDAADAAADPDGDGFDNRQEVLAGTDPQDGASFPVVAAWAMLQANPRHSGYQPAALDSADFAPRWTVERVDGVKSVAADDAQVFVVSGLNLLALDAGTGAEQWVHSVPADNSISSPSFANDLVYLHTNGGDGSFFRAFRKDTGAQVFSTAHDSQWASYGAPTIFGDRAYMNGGYNGGIQAFNALTGARVWSTEVADWADGWEPAVDADRIVLTKNGDLRALVRRTGTLDFVIEANLSTGTPVLGGRGNVLVGGGVLTSFDIATRSAAWEVPAPEAGFGRPAVGNGMVFAIQSGELVAFNEANGARLWQWKPPSGTLTSNLVVTLNHVFAASATTTYAIDLRTHAQAWSYALGGSLALASGGALFIAGATTLVAIDVEGDTDGDALPQWWERRYGGDVDAAADADGDGLTALEEYAHETDPTNGDSDGDGLSDGAEVTQHATDPNRPDSDKDGLSDGDEVTAYGSDPRAFDTDGDGLDDGAEVAHGLDPRDAADGAADPDGDGFDNRYEVRAGTDPHDGAFFPVPADWAMVQGNPRHDGYQPLMLYAEDFAKRWTISRPEGVSPVATGDGKVFTVCEWSVVALDAATGAAKWTRPVGGTPSVSAPSFANDFVYIHIGGPEDYALLAFRKDTGVRVFKTPHDSQGGFFAAPTIFKDRAYINGGTYGGFEVFNALTGPLLWKTDLMDWTESIEPAVNEELVFATKDGDLRAKNRLTGAEKFVIDASLAAQTPVLGSRGNVLAAGATLVSFDIATRARAWEVTAAGGFFQNPAVGNGVVFCLQSGGLVAFHEASGERLWQWRSPQGELSSNLVVTASHVFVGTSTATYAVDVTTHEQAWSYAQEGALALSKDGVLLIAGGDGGHALTAIEVQRTSAKFRRGDANADGSVDVADGVTIVYYLFAGQACACVSALDANDDGQVDTSDAVYVLYHLFLHGPPPPSPFRTCARDPTRDALSCEAYAPCADGR